MESFEEALPQRKHPTHGILSMAHQPTIIFDTVCTRGRKRWLASVDVHNLLRDVWTESTTWVLGRYVIMPDHIHFFAAATDSEISYENWVKYWKSQFSKQHGHPDHRWLVDHWDRRMCSEVQYEDKWNYVRHNPVRHGLVDHPDEWPYQGEVYRLEWH